MEKGACQVLINNPERIKNIDSIYRNLSVPNSEFGCVFSGQ